MNRHDIICLMRRASFLKACDYVSVVISLLAGPVYWCWSYYGRYLPDFNIVPLHDLYYLLSFLFSLLSVFFIFSLRKNERQGTCTVFLRTLSLLLRIWAAFALLSVLFFSQMLGANSTILLYSAASIMFLVSCFLITLLVFAINPVYLVYRSTQDKTEKWYIRHLKKGFVVYILLILIAGFSGHWLVEIEKSRLEGYQWHSDEYSNVSWNKITHTTLSGLTPSMKLIRKTASAFDPDSVVDEIVIFDPDNNKNRLMDSVDNNLPLNSASNNVSIPMITWLETLGGLRIDSLDELRQHFAPVESEAEAVSFAALVADNFSVFRDNIRHGYTAIIEGGFLVHFVISGYSDHYGDSYYDKTHMIYEVSRTGAVTHLAEETMDNRWRIRGRIRFILPSQ